MKIRPWLQGVGMAMLYLLPLFAIFLAPTQDGFYHQVMPITSLTRGALLDLLLMGLLLGAGFAWLHRVKGDRLARLLWLFVLLFTAWVAERGIAEFFINVKVGIDLPAWVQHTPWLVLAAGVVLLLGAHRYYDILIQAVQVFLLSAGFAAILVILPRLGYMCFNHALPEQASFIHPVRQPWQPGEPRIVWLLFDELSYNQAFDHTPPGIALPAFTQLRQESISFSQVLPVGYFTDVIIPALFLGQPVSEIKSNHRGELLWRSSARAGWQLFDPDATVFGVARRQGWSSGIAGWYNPYCRLFASVVDSCYWTFQDFSGGARFSRLSSARSTLENARDALPLLPQLEHALGHDSAIQGYTPQSHRSDFQRVMKAAKSLIADPNIRFSFIHLPVPHPPGIYPNPQTGGEDYLGNLLLADQTLAELRAQIADGPGGADTILIVSSDHSWRVPFWRTSPGWTPAEERATGGGVFDPRPVLIVHFPGQKEPVQIDRPVSEPIVHSLLLDLIQGKVHTAEQWVAALQPGAPVMAQGSERKK